VTVTGMSENHISVARLGEQWNEYTDLGLLQQIGIYPSMVSE